MLKTIIDNNTVRIGDFFSFTLQRTLRIPDNDETHRLPPSLGSFPVRRVADYADRVPESWREHGGVFIPMYQREAMWINFHGKHWHPQAIKVGVGKVNAVSGRELTSDLQPTRDGGKQDYLVAPGQPWLDGINSGRDTVRQFVAMPLGMGYTVEGQVTGEETNGGLQIICFDAKPGIFPNEAPIYRSTSVGGRRLMRSRSFAGESTLKMRSASNLSAGSEMGLAAGGQMRQQLHADRHGIHTWDESNMGRVFIHIVNSEMWQQITGEPVPPTPVTAESYTIAGLPWFDYYREGDSDIEAPGVLQGVKSVAAKDKGHGFSGQQNDGHLPGAVAPAVPGQVQDGVW